MYINEHNGFVDCFANDENNDDDDKDNVVVFPRFITQDTVHFLNLNRHCIIHI